MIISYYRNIVFLNTVTITRTSKQNTSLYFKDVIPIGIPLAKQQTNKILTTFYKPCHIFVPVLRQNYKLDLFGFKMYCGLLMLNTTSRVLGESQFHKFDLLQTKRMVLT
jgi:hypothetical protein